MVYSATAIEFGTTVIRQDSAANDVNVVVFIVNIYDDEETTATTAVGNDEHDKTTYLSVIDFRRCWSDRRIRTIIAIPIPFTPYA